MELTLPLLLFYALLVSVGVLRLVELRISQHRRRILATRHIAAVTEPYFAAMVIVHAGILVGAAAEAGLASRPFIPALAAAALLLTIAANALRWWVIATLGAHWNVRIMASLPLGIVSDGPYRFIRHPNYVAVFVELCALPLVHSAWITSAAGAVAHAWVLHHRIRTEDTMLLASPAYRTAMAGKPRFVPRLPRRI